MVLSIGYYRFDVTRYLSTRPGSDSIINCCQELVSYLRCVKEVWDYITGSTEQLADSLDATTVSMLEGRCPQVAGDLEIIEHDRSKIFPLIKDPATRQAIWQRLQDVSIVIPSLHTFLEDTKYLEPCAKILKQVLPRNSTRSVYQGFSRLHDGRYTLREQQSERASKLVRQPSAKEAFRQAYLQLWLYAMRHFPEMTGHAPRKDLLRTKPTIPQVEYIWWNGITNLAKECGFENIVEAYPTVADADHRMAEDFLASARPSPKFRISMEKSSSYVQQLVDIIRSVEDGDHTEISTPAPCLSSDSRECGFDVSSRCGVPHEQSFQQDCKWLFLENMSVREQLGPAVQRKYLTSFGVKKGMFQRFFIHELAGDDVAGQSMIPQDDEVNSRPDDPPPGDGEGEPRPDDPAPGDVEGEPRPDEPAPGDGEGESRLDAITEDITMVQHSDQSTPLTNQTAKRRRSTDVLNQDLHTTSSVLGTAMVPASYTLDISNEFVKESNVDRVRARQLYRNNSDTRYLILIKAKSAELYDVHSIPRDRQDKILECLGDKRGKFYFTMDPGKRLRTTATIDIARKIEQPVLVVSSRDEKQIRAWFEEDTNDIMVE